MRVLVGVLLTLLTVVGPASAEDEAPSPSKPLTAEQAADAALAAVKAKDDKTLKVLASHNNPDPWMVADVLCYRGEHDVADAFAKAAPRTDVKMLPAYVAARRGRTPDKAERDLMTAMNAAMGARTPQTVVDTLASLPDLFDTVIKVRLGHSRGMALRLVRRVDDSKKVLHKAAAAAAALGWLTRASHLYSEAGKSAYLASDWPGTMAILIENLALEERRANKFGMANVLGHMGLVYFYRGEYAKARDAYERSIDQKIALGNRQGASRTLGNLGLLYKNQSMYAKALAVYKRALAEMEEAGDKDGAAGTLLNMGDIYNLLGDYQTALSFLERALDLSKALGDDRNVAKVLGSLGITHERLGDYPKAIALYERSLKQKKALGDWRGEANTLSNLGNVYQTFGDLAKALTFHQRALEKLLALSDPGAATWVLVNIGSVHVGLGQFAKGLSLYERALGEFEANEDRQGVADTLGNIGLVHLRLADYAKARSTFERVLEMVKTLGDKRGVATTLGNMGGSYSSLGDFPKALELYERVLVQMKALGDKRGEASTLGNIGAVRHGLGDHAKARESLEKALEQLRALGDREEAARVLVNLGGVYQALGDTGKALSSFKRAASEARSLRLTPVLVLALESQARLYLDEDKPSRALARAGDALGEIERLLGGLGEEQGATAREQRASLFAIGALAAAMEEEVPETLRFLESGRAGAQLDSLDKREALRWKAESLPPELRQADLDATAAENVARRAYDRATRRGRRKEARAASKVLEDATARVGEVAGRIQRELKQQAGLFYPRAKTIYDIQDALESHQALILYGLCLDDAIAVVLRQDSERVVRLGAVADVESACSALHASDVKQDPAAAFTKLRTLLVEPLKLGKDVKQVLVSPEGPLGYVPFGALFSQVVAMTPSGTTHCLLLDEEREPGKGVLALGNPNYSGVSEGARAIYYRGRSLVDLPASGVEVKAIGTTTLLGSEASEVGLRKALKTSKRWKSVHFACHGLIDVERPMLSSLALSRAGEDDGFLNALELLRIEIPADLAVLSACETGTGKIYKGEGIVGLTRAFMFAGAPRVICSLWKVDDEATKALMVKFYELWNPKGEAKGLGAAAALKQAQAFIRDHENGKWKHPFYWAAWVLWGLPN